MSISKNIENLTASLPKKVTLVAVSKTKPIEAIMEAYNTGLRIFGENKIQEMVSKWETMPKDIQWHMIGHVQTNKVKYMASFVSLIHAIDSIKLLKEVNKQAKKHDRVIDCLLQVKIAKEESKFGLDEEVVVEILNTPEYASLKNISIVGLMGMATFTDNKKQIINEFNYLQTIYNRLKLKHPHFRTLSMGMSADYPLAIKQGSTMVRVGSAIFGSREY